MRKVAVLDHGMGNLRSVAKALEAAGADVEVTSDLRAVERVGALCVPGQGIFGRCVQALSARGADEFIRSWIAEDRPFLGICLGMQVLFDSSDEDDAPGLGVFQGHVARLPSEVTVPHIGWNEVETPGTGRSERKYFYFDHSYAVQPTDETIVSGWCEHGRRFAASVEKGALLGVQFHPEKSGTVGIDLLRRWVKGVSGEGVGQEDPSKMETRT